MSPESRIRQPKPRREQYVPPRNITPQSFDRFQRAAPPQPRVAVVRTFDGNVVGRLERLDVPQLALPAGETPTDVPTATAKAFDYKPNLLDSFKGSLKGIKDEVGKTITNTVVAELNRRIKHNLITIGAVGSLENSLYIKALQNAKPMTEGSEESVVDKILRKGRMNYQKGSRIAERQEARVEGGIKIKDLPGMIKDTVLSSRVRTSQETVLFSNYKVELSLIKTAYEHTTERDISKRQVLAVELARAQREWRTRQMLLQPVNRFIGTL